MSANEWPPIPAAKRDGKTYGVYVSDERPNKLGKNCAVPWSLTPQIQLVCGPESRRRRYSVVALGKFELTLSVNGIVTLRISTSSGYVHVFRGPDGQVHVVGQVKANRSRLGSSLDAVAKVVSEPPIDQAGNIIRIGGRHSNLSIDYDVATPRNTILAVQSGSGDVQVTDIRTVEAETASGEIRAQRLGADSELKTGSGTIEASDLDGPSVLQAGSGDIRASYSAPGHVTANTGSGSVSLRNVQGGLKVETGSGALEIEGKPTGPWKLETGFGSINVDLGSSDFALDAETGSGTVTSDLPITVQRSTDKRHIVGKVNNGGPTVRVQTGSGDIRIK
jgi:DUF4097 and DUF4098 domain-containing protein YvlB